MRAEEERRSDFCGESRSRRSFGALVSSTSMDCIMTGKLRADGAETGWGANSEVGVVYVSAGDAQKARHDCFVESEP